MTSKLTDRRAVLGLAVLGLALAPALAFAQTPPAAGAGRSTPEQRQQMRERWEQMTPAEREKARAEGQARREERLKNMTPEQRAEQEKRRADARERWEKMSPEEKEQMRKRMQERRGQGGPGGPPVKSPAPG